MARQSTDDGIGRDPRFDRMAELVGWTKRELVGCFSLDVWPLCYDRVTPNVPAVDIEAAAKRGAISPVAHPGGFVGAMLECGLGRKATKADTTFVWSRKGKPDVIVAWRDTAYRDRIYVCGSAKRIAYLVTARQSGHNGGIKSGESRADTVKGASRVPQGTVEGLDNTLNPTVTVTDTASDTSTPKKSRGDRASPRFPIPDLWVPERSEANLKAEAGARARGVDLRHELIQMRDWAVANAEKKADWDATWRGWVRRSRGSNGSTAVSAGPIRQTRML